MPDTFLIDRHPAVALLHAMLTGQRPEHILRLTGEAKMGKSHLLRRYRRTAQHEHQARCALIDLRFHLQGYDDLMYAIAQQLGTEHFAHYQTAQDELVRRPQMEVNRLTALLSRVSLGAAGDKDTASTQRRRFTTAFLQDLEALPSSPPVLIMFDVFEGAAPSIRDWLHEHLLTGLCRLPHVWTVVAGRSLPEPLISWCDTCHTHELPSVSLEDHRRYCRHIGAELSDEIIEVLHNVLDGKPGLFVEMVASKYGRRREVA
jgi:hypothetical protein